MGTHLERLTRIQYPPVALTQETRSRAKFLINSHYTKIYGKDIRYESTRSMRVKILELEAHMDNVRLTNPTIYRTLARQCVDFERICALLEILN